MNPSARLLAALAAVLALLVGTAPLAGPASAQTGGSGGAGPVSVILDASGSMTTPDAGDRPRIDAAKDATRSLVEGFGESRPFSLFTYGTQTGSSDAEKEAGCRDITELRPMRTGDPGSAAAAVDGLVPRGYTPIGAALSKAAGTLPAAEKGTIVLVSDGIDTCSPPPACEVAQALRDNGVDVTVNTIGLNIDAEGRAELECIARATGGRYADATDTASLTESMAAAARPAEGFAAGGQELAGATGRWDRGGSSSPQDTIATLGLDQAPTVSPGPLDEPLVVSTELPAFPADFPGDTEGTHSMTTSYAVDLAAGDSVLTGLIAHPGWKDRPSGPTDGTYLEIAWAGPGEVPQQTANDQGPERGGLGLSSSMFTAPDDGRYTVTVSRRGPFHQDEPLPAELRLAGFAAGSDVPTTLPSAPAEQGTPAKELEPSEPVRPADAGTSPATAAAIEPGTVSADIAAGETRFFAVPAQWGQRVAARLFLDEPGDAPKYAERMEVSLLNPLGQDLDTADHTSGPEIRLDRPSDQGYAELTRPIEFAQRDTTTPLVAGTQLIAVTMRTKPEMSGDPGLAPGAAQVPSRIRLVVDVTGDPQPGPQLSPLGGGGQTSGAATTTNTAVADGQDDRESQDQQSSSPWALVGGGIAALAVVAAVLTLVLRRRNHSR